MNIAFFKGKRVLITGHTGFKGTWLCKVLLNAGADISGYALEPPTHPSLYNISGVDSEIRSFIGDIRDKDSLNKAFSLASPEIVFHLAAQPIVREGYREPAYTYETNIMGTINILECTRNCDYVKSFLNVTTDKVYENKEWEWGYRENDTLNGYDPYSNSKSCSELVTQAYRRSFFSEGSTPISTARAGNVIGGGDFSVDRIIPDCVRAAVEKSHIVVRNPDSIRPYQHVLEPICAYILIAERQYVNPLSADSYNVGPDDNSCIATGELASIFCKVWGDNLKWINKTDIGPHESGFLKLDCSKIKTQLGWRPIWDVNNAVRKTVEWSKAYYSNSDINLIMNTQINDYLADGGN